MITPVRSPTPPLDLRTEFGDRFRLGWEADGITRSAWAVAEQCWLLEIRCRYGTMYPHGGDLLAAFTDRPRVGARLRRLRFLVSARGDREVVVTFHVNDVEEVFAVLKPYRRRRLSPAQRAKNAATLARARQQRLQPLTQSDFPAPESTRNTRTTLRHHRQPENRSALAEVRPVRDSGHGRVPSSPRVHDDRLSSAPFRRCRRPLSVRATAVDEDAVRTTIEVAAGVNRAGRRRRARADHRDGELRPEAHRGFGNLPRGAHCYPVPHDDGACGWERNAVSAPRFQRQPSHPPARMGNTTPLPPVEVVDGLARDALPAFLAQLAALQGRAAARLAAEVTTGPLDVHLVAHGLDGPDILGVREAARTLAISTTALRRLETAGMIPSVRVGRRVLFRRETLLRFAADNETARI